MISLITDAQIADLLDLFEEIEKGVKWERIPFAEIMALLHGINDKYPVEGVPLTGPHLVDLEADPYIPTGWSVHAQDQIKSRVRGKLTLVPDKICLHVDQVEEDREHIVGYTIKKSQEGKPVVPAHVLDYLRINPHLIPIEWKGKAIFFWGTIYRNCDGKQCVRSLYWDGAGWAWHFALLEEQWLGGIPSAQLAS